MATEVRYSDDEAVRRGQEFYETRIRPVVERDNDGRIIAIDVETGDYGMGDTSLEACAELRKIHPDAFFYLVRVGHRTVHQIKSLRPRQS